jgi:protein arginine kinase activator
MKCDLCGKPAVVHETTVKNGVPKEVHLCEDHAAEVGIEAGAHPPINQILTQFVISKSTGTSLPARAVRKACPRCGLSFAQLRQKGLVGCPQCYRTFERHLTAIVERAHNGGTHHVGRAPRRAGVTIDRQRQVQQLLKELDAAVASEQYERAATLRDRINTLKAESVTGQRAAGDEPR